MPSSDKSGKTKHPKGRLRKAIRLFLSVLALILIVLLVAVLIASQRLPQIARWAIERSLPGVRAELKDLTVTFPNAIAVKDLVLTARDGGERLLALRGGSVNFDFYKLAGRELALVTLEEPVLVISPKLLGLLGPGGSNPSTKKNQSWKIARVKCDYGELVVTGIGPESLKIQSKFAFDLVALFASPSPNQTATFWDMEAFPGDDRPVLRVDLAELGFDLDGMKAGRLESLELKGGDVLLGERLLSLFKEKDSTTRTSAAQWILGKLQISRLGIDLEDDRELAPNVQFDLNTTLQNIPLNKAASTLGEELQHVEIADLEILSPLDPLAKVLSIRSLAFEFTLNGLLRKEIQSVSVTSPSVYVSQDLFWYMDHAQAAAGGTEPTSSEDSAGWTVRRFTLVDGRLILGSGGRSNYGLPLTFRTSATDVSLENLASLRMQAVMEIPSQTYSFPNYQLEFESREGELRFAYPPEKNENNLVGTITLDTVRWRQYQAHDAWVSVTFDRQGINGSFGGTAYKGYNTGGFSFFFQNDAPWIGWVAGEGIDLKKLTNVISPQNFQMTGPMDYQVQIDARRTNIHRVKGKLEATRPGTLRIAKLDDLLGRIPDAWSGLKQSSTRIALETLRDFDFETCKGNFWFVDSQGVLDLALQGPSGSRKFEVMLHSDDSPQGLWKKRTSKTP